MPHLSFGWKTAMELAALLFAISLLFSLWRSRAGRFISLGFREWSVMTCLYGLWGLVGYYTVNDAVGAVSRGQSIWDWERRLHVVDEAWLQHFILPHGWLVHLANGYYIYGHFNALIAMLAWLWLRHRDAYPRVRLTIIVFTLLATAVQVIPVAPPRLLPGHLIVDTPTLYGESAYDAGGLGALSQLAAMPSIHVGWSTLIAWTVIRTSTSRWRWLVLVHPILMNVVVVVTGNHYWADGAVSIGLLVITAWLMNLKDLVRDRLRQRRAVGPGDAPMRTGVLSPR